MSSDAIRLADAHRKHLTRFVSVPFKLPADNSWWADQMLTWAEFSARAKQEWARMRTREHAVGDAKVID